MSLTTGRQLRTALRRLLDCVIAFAFIALAPGCGADKVTGTNPATIAAEFAVTSDSLVILGGSLPIVIKGSVATLPSTYHVVWTSSDPSVATVDNSGKVSGAGIGSVRISARLLGPDLDTGVVRSLDFRVKYRSIAISSIDSLTGLGQTVTPVVQGQDTALVARGAVVATLTSADPTIASISSSTLTAVKNGTTTISASFDGATAQTTIKVRQVAKSITLASTPLVFRSLERDTTIAVTVRDTRDNVMVTTPTWVATNPAAASVTGAGVLRAHLATATSYRVTVDTVTVTLPVSVSQVIASISKVAGDGQSVVAGGSVPIAPSVAVRDAGGAGIAGISVTFSVQSGGGSVVGPTVQTSSSGVATVGSWTLGTAAGANSLVATVGSLSQSFAASGVAGAAVRVHFTSSPAGTTTSLGATLAPTVSVSVVDANDNVITTSTASVSLALIGPGGTGSLVGTSVVSAVAGVAAFGALKAATPSSNYQLVAAASGVASDTTAAFTVLGPATKLVFIAQPTNAVASATLPSVTVAVQDAGGTTLTAATNAVTLTLATNPGGATLSGGTARVPASGVATFTALKLNRAGVGYTLSATATGLTSATSTAFDISAGSASRLSFVVAPTNVANAVAMTPGVQVTVVDADGNPVTTATGTMTATIASGTGATLSNATAPIAGGVATFSALTLTGTPGSFTLSFSNGTFTVTSAAITLRAGAATGLAFATAPATTALNGIALTPQPVVRVVDVSGNTVTTATGTMTASIVSGTGGTLISATAPITAGVATFTALELRGLAGGFTLQFSDGTRTLSAAPITLGVGASSSVAITTAPSTTGINGVALGTQPVVAVRDVGGNVVTSASGTMTATITSGTGSTLTGASVPITSGVAAFTGLTFTGSAGGFTLQFSDGTRATSSGTINIAAGAPTAVTFMPGTAPSATATNGVALPVQPAIAVRDASGNIVTSATGTVTASILTGTGGTLVNATAPITAGVATFTTLGLNGTPGAFTLQFSDGSRTVASSTITLGIGAPSSLAVVTQPSSSTVNGVALATQPVIKVLDAGGNLVTSAAGTITATIASGPGAGSLVSATAPISAGFATFSGLTLNAALGSYTLQFSDGTRAVTSGAITVTTGAQADIVFTVVPSVAVTNGVPFPTQPVVRVVDAGGVTVNVSGTMTATVATGTGTLANNAVPLVAGVATFTSLALNGTPGPFTLTFTNGTVSVTAGTIVLSAGTPVALDILTAPSTSATDGVALATQPVVRVVDADGATVIDATGTMTATIVSGSGAVLGNATAPITAGVATFSGLKLTGTIGSYALRFSDGTRTSITQSVTVGLGAPAALVINTPPSATGTSGIALATQPVVTVRDIGGNVVTTASGTMTATIASGSGATLSGATATIASGVATFSGLTFNGASGAYTLQFSDGTRTITSGTITFP